MLRYTLRQMEYFVTAAECGSVAGAADRHNVSQPSVSVAIAKLEAQFGVQLLIRHHAQGVTLTPLGQRLLADARDLLRQAEDLQQHVRAAGEAVGGALALGCYVTIAPLFMPAIITAFRAAYPAVDIRLHEGIQDELVAGLAAGRFDMALLYDINLPAEIETEELRAYPPYVLLPEGHRLLRRAEIRLADLAAEPFILLDVPPSRDYFTGLFEEAGLTPNIVFASPSFEMVRGLVGRKQGFSLLVTRPHGSRTYDGQRLVTRPLADDVRTSPICLARLSRTRPTKLMEAFGAFCGEWFVEQFM